FWQARSVRWGGLGAALQAGVSADVETSYNGVSEDSEIEADEIRSALERTDVRWAPFVRPNLMFSAASTAPMTNGRRWPAIFRSPARTENQGSFRVKPAPTTTLFSWVKDLSAYSCTPIQRVRLISSPAPTRATR